MPLTGPWGLSVGTMRKRHVETALIYEGKVVHVGSWNYKDVRVLENTNRLRATLGEYDRMMSILESFPGGVPTLEQVYEL